MRVALFTEVFLPKVDGVVNTLCRVLEHLRRRGHTGLVFAPDGGPGSFAGTRVIGLPSVAIPIYPELKLVPPLVDVEKELLEFDPDVVHIINPVSLGLAGLRAARSLGVPVVASYQTDLPGFAERWGLGLLREPLWAYFRWLHNQADLNLCPSCATQRELLSQGFERVQVWGRGVDTHRFNPAHRSAERRILLSGGHPEAPLLIYVGRLSPEKRVEWLLPVLKAVPEARLAIVGDGPSRPILERLFKDTNTVFTGHLGGDNLAQAYASGDIFVFPAANETFGNVVLEAMASGLPVVAPRAGEPSDLITHGERGLLFEPGDQDGLVDAVRHLVRDLEYARSLGASGRAYAETLNWELVLDGLFDSYARVASHRVLRAAA
ncbi:MAG: glycosyltransferase family 1 protein [Anaerolineae bacterium]|nr:glycosyltransferase family 1 protein [Anaerolineae bacterium]